MITASRLKYLDICFKLVFLTHLLNELGEKTIIIFCNTCATTEETAVTLRILGFVAIPLHGQLSQVYNLINCPCHNRIVLLYHFPQIHTTYQHILYLIPWVCISLQKLALDYKTFKPRSHFDEINKKVISI